MDEKDFEIFEMEMNHRYKTSYHKIRVTIGRPENPKRFIY